jgi:hypothetical protein
MTSVMNARLRGRVAEPVVAVARRQVGLQRRVLPHRLRVPAKVVPKPGVIRVRLAARDDDVEVMPRRATWPHECLPAVDPLVTLIDVAQLAQPLERGGHVARRPDDHVDVDDRLGGQTVNRRAAHVLDHCAEVGHRIAHRLCNLLEEPRPLLVVLGDDDGRGVGGRLGQDLVHGLLGRQVGGVQPGTDAGLVASSSATVKPAST